MEPKYLPKRGCRDLYAGKNILYLKDTKNLFYFYTENEKLQRLDLKVYVSDVKVIGNYAYVYNTDNNCIYEVCYLKKGNVTKKIHILSDLIKSKVLLHETPYFYDSVILLQKDHVRLNFNKINLIKQSNEIISNRNILAASNPNFKESRINNFENQAKKPDRLSKSKLEISGEFDWIMYPVNKCQEHFKKGTAISPSHYKISSIYSMINNINKSVERRKSHSPLAYFKKVNESISSEIYSGIVNERIDSNPNVKIPISNLSPEQSNKFKHFDFSTNPKILEKENFALPKLKLSDIIKTNTENENNMQEQEPEYEHIVQTSLNQIASPVHKNPKISISIDSINRLSVAGTKGADMSTFTPKSSICTNTNRQTNFSVSQSNMLRSHNYSFSINQEVGKSTCMSDIRTFKNLNSSNQITPSQHNQSREFTRNNLNISELNVNVCDSTQTTQLTSNTSTPYIKKSILNRPKLGIVKRNSEPIKLLNKSSNEIDIHSNFMRQSLMEQSKKMEILSIRDKPQLMMERNIDKNFERKNTLQPLELECTHPFQTRRTDTEYTELEITQCREYNHNREIKETLEVQEIVNTQEVNIENFENNEILRDKMMETFHSDKKDREKFTNFNKLQNLNASLKSSNESSKQNSPTKLGFIKKAKLTYQENISNFKPIKNPQFNNSVSLLDNKSNLDQSFQKNILSSSNAFSTKSSTKVNVIDIYTQKARERSLSVSNQKRSSTKPLIKKSRDPIIHNTSNTSFSGYIKNK